MDSNKCKYCGKTINLKVIVDAHEKCHVINYLGIKYPYKNFQVKKPSKDCLQ